MSTTNNLRPTRNTRSSATRGQRARRVTPGSRTGTRLPRTAQPAAYRAPSVDRRPRGHVVGHAIGEPPPVTLDGRPHGHVVGHAIGEPQDEVMKRRFDGGCVGYVYPTVRYVTPRLSDKRGSR